MSNVISEWFKNSAENEKYVVRLNDFNGQKYVDLRLFYKDTKGEWHFSKKGICLSVYFLDELKEAIDRTSKVAEGIDPGGNDESDF